MKIINLKIEDLKNCYSKNQKIILDKETYFIGKLCGAINDFLLFKKGRKYLVYSDYKKENETTFIIT